MIQITENIYVAFFDIYYLIIYTRITFNFSNTKHLKKEKRSENEFLFGSLISVFLLVTKCVGVQ